MQNGDKHLFSSTDSALRALERAGSPPKSIDISNPNTQCQTALDILAYLAHNNTTPWDEGTFFKSIVLKHWTSIGRWCRHFLEKFILAPEEPTTQQGLDFRDRILWALPSLFPSSYVSEDEHGHYARNFLRNSGRFLITPTVKVWLKLLDTCHPTTYKWTVFMLEIYFTRDPRLLQEFEDIIFDSKDRDVIGLSIRKMLQFASSCRFSLVDLGALLEFNMFMLLMTPYFHPSTILHDRFLSCGGVATLVRVLSAFLLGPTLTHFPDGSEGSIAGFKMVESCLNLLKECLDYPFSASEALQAGFLKAVVRAVEHYDHWKEKGSDYLGPALAEVLQRISRLLVHPPVCRRFKRSREKHVTADWEVLIESKYRYLWEVWDSCLYNLDTFNEIRNALKEPGLSLCDYDKLVVSKPRHGMPQVSSVLVMRRRHLLFL
ncbi:hypothetical protein VNI00_006697 [Paramarasmius palmivorus]|uniref:Uncharacterized protein n=1 Tax=Paramarasmius palmivorus TaxID=297713 RepID=A0AAW0D4I9_9AGAR